MTGIRSRPICVAACLSIGFLSGCPSGQGNYTGELAERSQENLRGMRAAAAYDSARQRFLSGDLEEALEQVETALTVKSKVREAHLLRVRILLEMGNAPKALEAVELSRRAVPEEARFSYYEGLIHEQMNRPQDALHAYREAMQMSGEVVVYKIAAAEMMIEIGQVDEAKAFLREQEALHPSSPAFLQTLGHLAVLEGETAEAARLFEEAYTLAPNEDALCEDLATARVREGRYREALGHLRRLLSLRAYEDRTDLQHMAVTCLLETDQPVEAREILRRMVRETRGQDYRVWRSLADVAVKMKSPRLLRDAAARMMAMEPSRPEGYLAMAFYHDRTGEPGRALATLTYCRQAAEASQLVDRYASDLQRRLAEGSTSDRPAANNRE